MAINFSVTLLLVLMFGVSPYFYKILGLNFQLIAIVFCILIFAKPFFSGLSLLVAGYRKKMIFSASMLILFPFLSLLWTSSFYVTVEALAAFAVLTYFSISILGCREVSSTGFICLIMITSLIVSILSILIILVVPSIGIQATGQYTGSAWQGVFEHKNSFSRMLGIGIISSAICFFSDYRKKWLCAFSLILMTVSLWMAKSGTVIIATSVSIIFLFLFERKGFRVRSKEIIGFVFVFIALFVPMATVFEQMVSFLMDVLGRDQYERSTLDVRFALWGEALKGIIQRPILGYGVGGFWGEDGVVVPVDGESSLEWMPKQSHNGLIELCLSLGFLGLLSFLYFYKQLLSFYRFSVVIQEKINWPIFFVFFLMINNTYSAFYTQIALPWFALFTVVLLEYREIILAQNILDESGRDD